MMKYLFVNLVGYTTLSQLKLGYLMVIFVIILVKYIYILLVNLYIKEANSEFIYLYLPCSIRCVASSKYDFLGFILPLLPSTLYSMKFVTNSFLFFYPMLLFQLLYTSHNNNQIVKILLLLDIAFFLVFLHYSHFTFP